DDWRRCIGVQAECVYLQQHRLAINGDQFAELELLRHTVASGELPAVGDEVQVVPNPEEMLLPTADRVHAPDLLVVLGEGVIERDLELPLGLAPPAVSARPLVLQARDLGAPVRAALPGEAGAFLDVGVEPGHYANSLWAFRSARSRSIRIRSRDRLLVAPWMM